MFSGVICICHSYNNQGFLFSRILNYMLIVDMLALRFFRLLWCLVLFALLLVLL